MQSIYVQCSLDYNAGVIILNVFPHTRVVCKKSFYSTLGNMVEKIREVVFVVFGGLPYVLILLHLSGIFGRK